MPFAPRDVPRGCRRRMRRRSRSGRRREGGRNRRGWRRTRADGSAAPTAPRSCGAPPGPWRGPRRLGRGGVRRGDPRRGLAVSGDADGDALACPRGARGAGGAGSARMGFPRPRPAARLDRSDAASAGAAAAPPDAPPRRPPRPPRPPRARNGHVRGRVRAARRRARSGARLGADRCQLLLPRRLRVGTKPRTAPRTPAQSARPRSAPFGATTAQRSPSLRAPGVWRGARVFKPRRIVRSSNNDGCQRGNRHAVLSTEHFLTLVRHLAPSDGRHDVGRSSDVS